MHEKTYQAKMVRARRTETIKRLGRARIELMEAKNNSRTTINKVDTEITREIENCILAVERVMLKLGK